MGEMDADAGDGQAREDRRRRLFVLLFLLLVIGVAGAGWKIAVLNPEYAKRLQSHAGHPSAPPPVAAANAPSFDIVRAEPSGAIMAAGRADPDATVHVLADGKVLGTAKADENGEWVAEPAEPLKKGDYTITLEAVPGKGGAPVASRDQVAISIEGGKEKPLVAILSEEKPAKLVQQPETKVAAAEKPAPAAPASATKHPSPAPKLAEVAPEAARTSPVAGPKMAGAAPPKAAEASPAVKLAKPQTQAAAETRREAAKPQAVPPSVAIASADYAESGGSGRLVIGGTGTAGSEVGVYVDNDLAGTVPVKPDGSWSFEHARKMEDRQYSIRADLAGKSASGVAARAEIEFEPAPPEDVANGRNIAENPSASTSAPAESSRTPKVAAAEPPRPQTGTVASAPSASVPPRHAELEAKPEENQLQAAEEASPPSRSEASAETDEPALAQAVPVRAPVKKRHHARRHNHSSSSRTVIVRRGDTLWDIASRYYGRGFRFTRIYRSNRGQIRDPNLIYPRQRITLPK
jgi:nucleoid-associated protein YgaU